jgi:hypothetical protein
LADKLLNEKLYKEESFMNKRGVRFKTPNEYGSYISDVLKTIDVTKYTWSIDNTEIYYGNSKKFIDYSHPSILEGHEFKSLIDTENYYVIFAELKAFKSKEDVVDVNTYEDFINSKAEIILLIADVCYYDIYCKGPRLIEMIYDNALDRNYTDLEYVGEEDCRYRMSV